MNSDTEALAHKLVRSCPGFTLVAAAVGACIGAVRKQLDERTRAVLERAATLADEGQPKESEAVLREALERAPNDPDLLIRTAVTVAQAAPGEAQQLLDRAVAQRPHDPGVLFRSASILFALGEFEAARAYARRARDHATADFPLLIDLVHLAGRLADQKGNHADAERALRTAFTEEPGTLGHGRELAAFLARRGRFAEAYGVVAEALRHRPDDRALVQLRDELRGELGWPTARRVRRRPSP